MTAPTPQTFVVLLDADDRPDRDGLDHLRQVAERVRVLDPEPWPRTTTEDANALRVAALRTAARDTGLIALRVRQTDDVVVFARAPRFAWVPSLVSTVRTFCAREGFPPLTFQRGVDAAEVTA